MAVFLGAINENPERRLRGRPLISHFFIPIKFTSSVSRLKGLGNQTKLIDYIYVGEGLTEAWE